MSREKYVQVEFGWYVVWVAASVLAALLGFVSLIIDIWGYING